MIRPWAPEDLVVTGTGCVTPLGEGVEVLLQGWRGGLRAIRPVRRFETNALPFHLGGEMPEPRIPSPVGHRGAAHLGVAIEEAIRGCGLGGHARLLILVSTTKGFLERGAQVADRAEPAEPGLPGQWLSVRFPGSSVMTVSTACAGGTVALAMALAEADALKERRFDAILVVGIDLLSDFVYRGFSSLAAIDPSPCRPFDRTRAGMSPAEAVGVVVLETLAGARARGVLPLGRLLGGGLTSDAGHPTAPDPDGAGLARAVTAAMGAGGIGPEDLGHVNAHGTATVLNDAMEVHALTGALGSSVGSVPLTTLKGNIGHSFGAAGVVEFAASLAAVRAGVLPGIAGLEEPVPGIEAVSEPRVLRGPVFLKVGAGFGGFNAAVVAEGVLP